MSDSKAVATSELSFELVLFLIFLVLKLTGFIDWSWWWIFAPLWIPAGVALLIVFIIGIVFIYKLPKS